MKRLSFKIPHLILILLILAMVSGCASTSRKSRTAANRVKSPASSTSVKMPASSTSLEELGTGFLCVGSDVNTGNPGQTLPVVIYLDITGEQKAQLLNLARQQGDLRSVPRVSASIPQTPKPQSSDDFMLGLEPATPSPNRADTPAFTASQASSDTAQDSLAVPSQTEFDPLLLFKDPTQPTQTVRTSSQQASPEPLQPQTNKRRKGQKQEEETAPAPEPPKRSSGRPIDAGYALPF